MISDGHLRRNVCDHKGYLKRSINLIRLCEQDPLPTVFPYRVVKDPRIAIEGKAMVPKRVGDRGKNRLDSYDSH